MKKLHPYLTPENAFLFRITHESNLSFILKNGLVCPNHITRDPGFRVIANGDVDEKRESHSVPITPGGVLHDYVPFYFAPRSPMLYWNYKQGKCPQEEIIYLATKVENVVEAGCQFVFTSAHAIMAFSTWHHQLKDLAAVIDWPLMQGRYWNDVAQDNDRRRRRMAEFLIYQHLPLTYIKRIGVKTEEKKLEIEAILLEHALDTPVVFVRPDWYF